MLEKHCFISPFVYKEMAQIRGTYGSSVWALFHLPNIYFSHTEKVRLTRIFHMDLTALWLTLGFSALHGRSITSSAVRHLIRATLSE